jgi:lysozyme
MYTRRIIQFLLIVILLAVSMGAATRAQAWSYCGSTYVVQRGDWLAKIARKCGVTLSQLYAANPWVGYYYYIYPGQVLVIPGGYDPIYSYCGPGYDSYGSYYIVCRGDTLGGIALYYGVTVNYLQWRNNIRDANRIYAGQVIRPY